MFGVVSKKKYKKLEEQYSKLKEIRRAEWDADLLSAEKYVRLQEIVIDLQKENKSLQERIAKWKQMYADEVQKRIEMAEFMKNQ
jgi:hypothetical protein